MKENIVMKIIEEMKSWNEIIMKSISGRKKMKMKENNERRRK